MRYIIVAAAVLGVVGTAACGPGTFFAADRPTPGGQSSNAQGGRRGFGVGIGTVGEELASRGVVCGKPSGEHARGVLYMMRCR